MKCEAQLQRILTRESGVWVFGTLLGRLVCLGVFGVLCALAGSSHFDFAGLFWLCCFV